MKLQKKIQTDFAHFPRPGENDPYDLKDYLDLIPPGALPGVKKCIENLFDFHLFS